MKKDIDWNGFKENVETYISKHRGISGNMLKQLFDNYSEKAVKNCNIPVKNGSLPLTDEKKLELILKKFHSHTKNQWEDDLVKEYPYCEIPCLVELVWNEAQRISNSLPDEFGHHNNFRYCPGCGKEWVKDSEQFGCWSCGFIMK